MSFRIETTTWIDRVPGEVFAYLSDHNTWSTYVPGLIRSDLKKDTGGVGTQFSVHGASMGSTYEVITEWTRYEKDAAIGSRNIEGPVGVEMLTSLTEENGGTRIERVLEVEPKGIFLNLATPLIRRKMQRDAESEFATLKDLLETAEA
jgi:hypothetical protein